MSKKKFEKTRAPKRVTSKINPTALTPRGISFSFKYYQQQHQKFNCADQKNSYLLTLLERLKDLSGWSVKEFLSSRTNAVRGHAIDWAYTSEDSFGLPNEDQLVDTPYQFSLSSNKHGRVHGFIVGEVFYVVWLDPGHLLYSSKR